MKQHAPRAQASVCSPRSEGPPSAPARSGRSAQAAGNEARKQELEQDPRSLFDAARKRGPGGPVPWGAELGAALGVDLSGVRAWFGSDDDGETRGSGGKAFRAATDGTDIVFAEAHPDKETVAHELVHIAQTRNGGGGAAVSRHGDAPEEEARSAAGTLAAGGEVAVQEAPTAALHLDDGEESAASATPAPTESTLQSEDPQVDGRTVRSVGADLTDRASRYRDAVPRFRSISESTQQQEEDWYEELGLIGGFIDLFNEYHQTDPTRWDLVLTRWQDAEGAFQRALSIQVSDATINRFGTAGEEAMQAFEDAYTLDSQYRDEFSTYMEGFAHSAQGVLTVTTIVRDVSFAAAVGIAVVLAAPVVLGAAGTAATGLGLTGAAATGFTYGTTAVSMGLLGAGIEGGGQAVGALVVEGCQLLSDLADENMTWEQAIDGFDWGVVAEQGWDGFKRGFVDGVLAFAGMGMEKVLGSAVRVRLDLILGEAGGTMLAQMLRRASERAIAGGATGGVIGALDAGIKTAMAGGTVGEVLSAVEEGFVLGAVIGTGLGAAGGALEGRGAAQVTQQVDELRTLLREDPEAFAARFNELVETMTPDQRAAFTQEVQGRRFVDADDYARAADRQAAGETTAPPEHAYGEQVYEDWGEAASLLEEHALSGEPLTQADVEAAHAAATENLRDATPGEIRAPGVDVLASGGLGYRGWWTALSPEQIAILESNPHIRLLERGIADGALSEAQVAAGLESAIVAYPEASTVPTLLDEYFAWYAASEGVMDPVALAAEAQRRLVSIHPFADGNGRVSRLVMDHALQSEGLPPALLRNPDLDYMISAAAWEDEVREGVLETYQTAQRHVGTFNAAARSGDPSLLAAGWGALVGLAGDADRAVELLYDQECE